MGVVIKEGIFEDENQEVVKQIQLSEVAVNARGFAITCIAEALPFLKAQNSISPDALGLLTTQPLPDELRGGLNITDVQFPALYKDTQEAILLRGTLIGVGDLRIAKKANPSAPAIELVDTVIVKIIGYRDEMDDHWERVLASPAKTLMDKLDALHLCKTPLCKGHCRAYHAAVEEDINQVVQDVWGRSFQKMAGGKTDPDLCTDTSPCSAAPRQPNQEPGRTGVYIEPRAESTLGPCPGFAVVWLPGKTLAEAQHIMATHEKALGIARLGQKWGIRVKTEDAAMLFGALRPGQIFMQLKLNAIYKVYPLPYGMQRAGVVALMKQWGWAAKPLQPARGSAAGGAWEVGAEKDPPSFAMQGPQGEVLIQLVKSLNRKTDGHPAPVIPQRTRQYLQSDKQGVKPKHGGSNTQDPWQQGTDPWSSWFHDHSKGSSRDTSTGNATTQKLQLEHQLKEDVKRTVHSEISSLHGGAMETEDPRLGQLEVAVQELRHQNTKFEGWFTQAGHKTNELTNQVHALCATVDSQQKDIQAIRQEVQDQPNQIQTAMQTALQTMGSQFSMQFQQLQEAIVDLKGTGHADKKQRAE